MAMKQGELIPYVFEHEQFGKIRALNLDGEPLFVGKDIANALGYSDAFAALKQHVPEKFKKVINAKNLQQMASQSKTGETSTFENPQQMASNQETSKTLTFEMAEWEFDSPRGLTFIKEQGIYRLVLRSKLPAAEQFTDWTCEVLVNLRKHGYYVSDEKSFGEELLDIFSTYGVFLCLQSELSLEIKSVQNFAEQLRWLKQVLAESPHLQAEVDSCIIGAAGIIERLNWFLVAVNSLKK